MVASLPTLPRTRQERQHWTPAPSRDHVGCQQAPRQCVTRSVCYCLTPPFVPWGASSQTRVCCGSGCTTASRLYRTAGERKERGARACVLVPVGASAYGCRTPDVNCPPATSLVVCGSPPVRASYKGAVPGTQGSIRSALGRATPSVYTHHALVIACASCEGRSTVPGACGAARWSILR